MMSVCEDNATMDSNSMPFLRYVVSNGSRYTSDAETKAELTRTAEECIKALLEPLTEQEKFAGSYDLPELPKYLYQGDSYAEAMNAFVGNLNENASFIAGADYTDGSPIQLPTEELVEAMLAGTSHSADETVGKLGPLYNNATVQTVAVNAVMAGCQPAYMPLLLAITECMANVDIAEANAGAGGWFHFAVLVNGPIAAEIGLNDGGPDLAGSAPLTQGVVANTTIGRFVRLMMVNVGGTQVGSLEAKGTGNPHKTSIILAEDAQSPWPAFSSKDAIGLEDGESTISFFVCWGDILQGNNSTYAGPASSDDDMLIQEILGSSVEGIKGLSRPQQGVVMFITTPKAQELAEAGFSREDVVHWISTHCVDTYADANARGLGKGVAGSLFTIQGVPIWETGSWPAEWSAEGFDKQTVVQWYPNEDAISLIVGMRGANALYMNGNPRWSVNVDPWR